MTRNKLILLLLAAFAMNSMSLLAQQEYESGPQGRSGHSQKELRDSISKLSQSIERYPGNVELRLRKAALNVELEQWSFALDEYSNVLDLQPENLTALYYRGFVNYHLARYSFARKDYETLLRVDNRNMHAMMGLVLTNTADGRLKEAFDGANHLVTVFPDVAEVYEVRAEVEERMNLFDAAADDMEKAIVMEERNNSWAGKTAVSVEDDMFSYQLYAFSLYVKLGKKKQAQKCLDYLVKRGIAKAMLIDYYAQLKR